MFKAFGRLIRAILYTLTGNFDYWSQVWESSPTAIRAQFDAVETEHRTRIQEVKRAVAGIMSVQLKKQDRLAELDQDVAKQEKIMAGALAMGQKRAQLLKSQGKSDAEIQVDADYLRCSGGFKDATSTLSSKKTEASRLHDELEESAKQLTGYEVTMQGMIRELGKIKEQKDATVADVEIAKQEKEANDIISGISQSRSGETLQRLQDMRRRITSEAKISQKLAGVEAKQSEDEFLKYALDTNASNEFDRLAGISQSALGNSNGEVGQITFVPVEKALGPTEVKKETVGVPAN